MKKLIGPFSELIPLDGLPTKGPLKDEMLQIIPNGSVLIDSGKIEEVGSFEDLRKRNAEVEIEELEGNYVGLPGFIDCHTHICFGGSRARDYAARNNGKTYQEIAASGGGIWDTVTNTRKATQNQLEKATVHRLNILLSRGITTIEVKSGYGLSVDEELKMLQAINEAGNNSQVDVIPTCLAAHIIPGEFKEESEYLNYILRELLPKIEEENLANRFDIFIEENAFTPSNSVSYLDLLKQKGFEITVHGDQFTPGGSTIAIEVGALSVDHLEASRDSEIEALAKSKTVPVVLPGASIGLGIPFAPARRLLNAGCTLAIASDWNPGSAPNGNLLTQAALLGAYEKLSTAEVFAGITYRSAKALNLDDRGVLSKGFIADCIAFEGNDYREILYHQGELQPAHVWKNGSKV